MSTKMNIVSIKKLNNQTCLNIPIVEEEKKTEYSTLDHTIDPVYCYIDNEESIQIDDLVKFYWKGITAEGSPLDGEANTKITEEDIDAGKIGFRADGKEFLYPLKGGQLGLYFELYRESENICSSRIKELKIV